MTGLVLQAREGAHSGILQATRGAQMVAVPTYYDGIQYRSKLEAAVAHDLTERGVGFEYEPLSFLYHDGARKYTPDFRLDNGVFIEVKGWLKREDRQKMTNVRLENPGIDLRLVLADPHRKLDRAKPITAEGWCIKNCWTWCEAPHIPAHWIY